MAQHPQAPQIPNLLSTLRSRPVRGARGARTGVPSSNDAATQQTDDDASGSRLSAVNVGYLVDPFARAFSKSDAVVRRQPIINRGTYVRTTSIDHYIRAFLGAFADQDVQVLSLGAGTDTRFFRLLRDEPELATRLHYHEVDFPSTVSKKIASIERNDFIKEVLKRCAGEGVVQITEDKTTLRSRCYTIHGLDLRQLAASRSCASASSSAQLGATIPNEPLSGLKVHKPTLILSECFLSYLESAMSTQLLDTLATHFLPAPTPLHVVLYEPLNPATPFGRTMLENLAVRSISMPGLEAFPTFKDHFERLRKVGFEPAIGKDIGTYWKADVSEEVKQELRELEGLDEEEEWEIMGRQWGVIIACRGCEPIANVK